MESVNQPHKCKLPAAALIMVVAPFMWSIRRLVIHPTKLNFKIGYFSECWLLKRQPKLVIVLQAQRQQPKVQQKFSQSLVAQEERQLQDTC